MSNSLQLHGLQHARLLCSPVCPRVCSNSCPLSWWCYLTISSSVITFSSCPQSFPASGFFPMSELFASQPKYWSFSFSISPSNEYSGLISFRIDWLDLFAVRGTLKSLLQYYNSKASILQCSAFFMVQSHICIWLLEKPQLWLCRPLSAFIYLFMKIVPGIFAWILGIFYMTNWIICQ